MANDNIKRYLDYDGLVYLINKFNSVIEANEQTTSEAINDLNQKIEELTDNTGGFPIIDADITQVDSIYTTTENLNELITPGQYIVDSSKIQYEDDTFIKTLYWLLSVDRVVYDNDESIVQTYYPLSYLSYKWFNIPVGGLLQRFYESNNTWTDLQIAAPGDVDPTKYVSQTEFNETIETLVTNEEFNETITPYTENIKFIDINEAIFITAYSLDSGTYTITKGNTTPIDDLFDPGIYYIKYNNLNTDNAITVNTINYELHVLEANLNSLKYITQIFELYNPVQFYGNPPSLRFFRYYDPSTQTWSDVKEIKFSKELTQPSLLNTEASKQSGKEPGYTDPEEEFIYVLKDPITSGNDPDMSLYLTGYGDSHRIELKIHKSYKMPTQKYIDENFIPKSESTNIWDAINASKVDNISLAKSGITKTTTSEEVDIPYITNALNFIEGPTGSFTGGFDVISLPTKNYVINNYVDKSSYIPNILKNDTPQAGGEKDFSLQWYQTSNAITDTNSTDFNDICAPSYSDFDETSVSFNKNSMVIRAFWTTSYFHDIWMSPNSDSILHRNINNGVAKPWKILLDNLNCGKYVKNAIKDSVDTNQITINNSFNCTAYANFRNTIGIYNSKNIDLVSNAQSKLPSESNNGMDLGTDAGDIIFYKNVGKSYTNPDGSTYGGWPEFVSGKPSGSFTEHYGPMEICRIYAAYTSANTCILNIRRAAGLVEKGNPQNQYVTAEIVDSSNFNYFLQQNNVITTSNISSNLPSTVITTSNISSNLPSTVLTTDNISRIEFKPSSGSSNGGYIDFHYDGSTSDFTSRIIEDAQGTITVSSSILKATGNINVGGGVYETSDETLKYFQDSIQVNFEQLKEIPKAYFTFKDDKTGEIKIGTSAQKVKEFYPELVTENNEGILSVDYAKLSIVALKAVDILDDRITKLEKLVEQILENK